MKLADFIVMLWLLAVFMCVLLAPFVTVVLLLSYIWGML